MEVSLVPIAAAVKDETTQQSSRLSSLESGTFLVREKPLSVKARTSSVGVAIF
jgi:hypothetical protein